MAASRPPVPPPKFLFPVENPQPPHILVPIADWPTQRGRQFGLVGLVIALALAFANLPQPFQMETIVIVLGYALLVGVSMVALGRLDAGVWTGYPHIVALAATLTLGMSTALLALVLGAGMALAAQKQRLFPLHSAHPTALTSLALGQIAVTGSAVVAASLPWTLLIRGPQTPTPLTWVLALALALSAGFLTAGAINSLIHGGPGRLAAFLRWALTVRLSLEILISLVIATFAVLGPFVPAPVQWLFLAVVLLQGIRHKTINQLQMELHERVEQLSQINLAVEALASTLALDALIETICRQAAHLAGAERVDLTLVDALDQTAQTMSYRPAEDVTTRDAHPVVAAILRDNLPYYADGSTPTAPTLGLPLSAGTEAIGALLVFTVAGAPLKHPVLDGLHMLARQAGLALNNALLYRQSQALVSNLSTVNLSVQDVMSHLNRREAVEQATSIALAVGKADAVLLLLQDDHDRLTLAHSVGLTDADQKTYATLVPQTPLHLPETPTTLYTDGRHDAAPALQTLAAPGGFQMLRAFPLTSARMSHGWMLLGNHKPRTLQASEQELLLVLTQHIAASIDNGEMFDTLESYAFEMAQLAHLSRTSASNLEMESVITAVGEILNQMMTVDRSTIALYDNDHTSLTVAGTVAGMTYVKPTDTDHRLARTVEVKQCLGQPTPSFRMLHADEPLSPALREIMTSMTIQTLIVVPMSVHEQVIGGLLLACQEKRTLDDREWQLAEMAANQIAAQVHNAMLYTTTQRALDQRLEQLALIEHLAGQISSTLDFNQIVKSMLEAAVRSTEAQYAALILLNEGNDARMIVIDYANGRYSRYFARFSMSDTFIGQVIRGGTTQYLRDTRDAPGYVTPRSGAACRSALAVPLMQDGNVLGVLNVESEAPDAFADAHIGFLNNLAGHAVISIGNARMMDERQHQVKVLTSLQALALQLSSAVDTTSAANTILETTRTLFDNDGATIYRYVPDAGTLLSLASLGGVAEAAPSHTRAARSAAQSGEIQMSSSTDNGEQSSINIPLPGRGRTRDVLSLTYRAPRQMTRRDYDTLALLASQAAGHLENARLHEEIRAGNERMAAILDSTRDGVILLDRNGVLVEANPAARDLLNDRLDDYLDDVRAGTPWERDASDAAATSGDGEALTRRQLEQADAIGGTRYLEEIGAPVLDESGGTAGWLLVLRDVTEARLLADYRDEITSMVVHDLRGPLASIISGLYIALDELSQHEPIDIVNTTVALASDSANRLMVLVESLLDVSRMEARQMDLRIDAIPVPRLVDRTTAVLASTLQQSDVRLEQVLDADLPPVDCDYDLLARVLINLLDNAVRFTPASGVVQVGATLTDDGEMLLMRVADSGRGIPPEERERVFEKFKQVKGATGRGNKRGTGLGLTFCRLAVEAHGGRIWVEPQGPLPGASFAFTIPLRRVETTPTAGPLSEAQ